MIGCRPETAKLLEAPLPTRCRIEWAIGEAQGNGDWFPISSRQHLNMHVQAANIRWGDGTHWVLEE